MREKQLQDDCVRYLEGRNIYHVVTHGNAFERRGRICISATGGVSSVAS
jgi:DNA-binding transcriptional regulator LsrR (DeoR family)